MYTCSDSFGKPLSMDALNEAFEAMGQTEELLPPIPDSVMRQAERRITDAYYSRPGTPVVKVGDYWYDARHPLLSANLTTKSHNPLASLPQSSTICQGLW